MADAPLHIIPADLLEAQVQLEQQGRRPQLRTSTTGGWQYFHTQLPPTQQQMVGDTQEVIVPLSARTSAITAPLIKDILQGAALPTDGSAHFSLAIADGGGHVGLVRCFMGLRPPFGSRRDAQQQQVGEGGTGGDEEEEDLVPLEEGAGQEEPMSEEGVEDQEEEEEEQEEEHGEEPQQQPQQQEEQDVMRTEQQQAMPTG